MGGASRCRMHGGSTPTKQENERVGAPEGNTHAMKHGLHADPWAFYNSLGDDEQARIDDIYQTLLDEAPNPDIDTAASLRIASIQIWKRRRANAFLVKEGLVKIHGEAEASVNAAGFEAREHPIHQPLDKVSEEISERLREAGVVGDMSDSEKSLPQILGEE